MSDQPYPEALRRFPRVRQSLLANFDDCALSARFDIDHRKGWDTHPQGRGQLAHRTFAKCLQEMAMQGESEISMDVTMAIHQEVIRQHDVDDICHEPFCDLPAEVIPEPERDPEDPRSLRCADGHEHHSLVVNVPARERADLEWIVRKWAKDNIWDTAHLVDIERRLEAIVSYPNEITGGHVERRLTGALDAIFVDPDDSTHAIVLDWKDTWRLPAQTEVSFEGYFQQRFYAFLVLRSYRTIQSVTLREFYVRYSEPREATLYRHQMETIEQDLSALVERFDQAVQRASFKPTPGRHCGFCARPQSCPIPVAVRAEGRITDEATAQRLGGQLVVAEKVLVETRAALKTYVDINGPVPVKDSKGQTVWAYEQVERQSKPTAEQVAEAHRQGRDPAKLFKTSKGTRFAKITRKPGHEESEDDALMAALKHSLVPESDIKWEKGQQDG